MRRNVIVGQVLSEKAVKNLLRDRNPGSPLAKEIHQMSIDELADILRRANWLFYKIMALCVLSASVVFMLDIWGIPFIVVSLYFGLQSYSLNRGLSDVLKAANSKREGVR